MSQIQKFNSVLKTSVFAGDLVILNILFIAIRTVWNELSAENDAPADLSPVLSLLNACYLACTVSGGVVLHRRGVRADQVLFCVLRNMFYFILLFLGLYAIADYGKFPAKFFGCFFTATAACLCAYRLAFRAALQAYRSHGGNTRSVVFMGSTDNILELHHEMSSDTTTGYRIMGYFDARPNPAFACPYLGTPEEATGYLEQHHAEQLYCCLPAARNELIVSVINYCENHLVHFYNVPNVRNYLRHRMCLEMRGSVPILSLRHEPLSRTENKLMKRAFDILFSLLFLCTLFIPICLVVGAVIKITSPGPVFFKQKRNGLNGKEFWCYKFRSMKVNADADRLQATADDPRKTRFGDFLRRSNLDELPQFINVLKGDMSVVGPRPHMISHTERYSAIINKYMVRHFIKPGITGWAQVTGFRGETKKVEEMEGRVKADIWYMEHWTFMLDLYIIYKTLANMLRRDKKAY